MLKHAGFVCPQLIQTKESEKLLDACSLTLHIPQNMAVLSCICHCLVKYWEHKCERKIVKYLFHYDNNIHTITFRFLFAHHIQCCLVSWSVVSRAQNVGRAQGSEKNTLFIRNKNADGAAKLYLQLQSLGTKAQGAPRDTLHGKCLMLLWGSHREGGSLWSWSDEQNGIHLAWIQLGTGESGQGRSRICTKKKKLTEHWELM